MSKKEQQIKIRVAGLSITLVRKPIKHMYLRIYPPDGRVVVTASHRFSKGQVEAFVSSRKDYITAVQLRQRESRAAQHRALLPGGTVYRWGEPLRVSWVRSSGGRRGRAAVVGGKLVMTLPLVSVAVPAAERAEVEWSMAKAALIEFYRREIKSQAPALIARWQRESGLQAHSWDFRKMHSRWGSCRPATGRISLNLYLAALPITCLAYVIVHELVHLKERHHNQRFYNLLDSIFPDREAAECLLRQERFLVL